MAERRSPVIISPLILHTYANLFDDLRFMKKQQWTITNYLVAISAGIFGIADRVHFGPSGRVIAMIIVIVGAAFSICLIEKIQNNINITRQRFKEIEIEYASTREKKLLKTTPGMTGTQRDWPFKFALIAVSIIAAAFVSYGLWNFQNSPTLTKASQWNGTNGEISANLQ